MANKYMCIRQCYCKNEKGQWNLYEVGQTEWRDKDPGKHWSLVPTGEPVTAVDLMRAKCRELGIDVDPKWEVSRLQREYDHRIKQNYAEQDKRVMQGTVAEPDARVRNVAPEEIKKRK